MKSFIINIAKLAAFPLFLSSCNQNEARNSEQTIGHELKNADGNYDDIINYLKNNNSSLLNSLDSREVEYRIIVGKYNDCVFVKFSGNVLHRGPDMIACKSRANGKILDL